MAAPNGMAPLSEAQVNALLERMGPAAVSTYQSMSLPEKQQYLSNAIKQWSIRQRAQVRTSRRMQLRHACSRRLTARMDNSSSSNSSKEAGRGSNISSNSTSSSNSNKVSKSVLRSTLTRSLRRRP